MIHHIGADLIGAFAGSSIVALYAVATRQANRGTLYAWIGFFSLGVIGVFMATS